jgi:raffinose/stachyose/melibiose transport system permease protein
MSSKKSSLAIILMLGPALVLYGVLVLYPMVNSFFLSLYAWPGVGPRRWVGLENYIKLFTRPPWSFDFGNALSHNVLLFGLAIVLKLVVGMLLALVLAENYRGARVYRTVVFLPIVISLIAVGFLWKLMLQPQWGAVPGLLRLVGLGHLVKPWLGDARLALVTIAVINAWRSMGFVVVVLGAAMLAIPAELDEAAIIDGASTAKRWRYITVPLSIPTVLTLLTLEFIWSFEQFDLVYALETSEGGPSRATDVLGLLFYRSAFGGFSGTQTQMGFGAAIAFTMFLMILPISIQLGRLRSRYDW